MTGATAPAVQPALAQGAITPLDGAIRQALGRVQDPCSVAAGLPLDVVGMGLLVDWTISAEGDLSVRLCATGPCCTMMPHIARAAEQALRDAALPGVRGVAATFDPGFFWSPERLTREASARLDEGRQQALAQSGARPRQWKEAASVVGSAPRATS